jgi:hypothetical protein
VLYAYRGKGGKCGRRELPEPPSWPPWTAYGPMGGALKHLDPDERVFNCSVQGFYLNLRRYLRKAKLRRDVGESIEDVSRFLDHGNLGVTTTYLRRLEGEQDDGWRKVAALNPA